MSSPIREFLEIPRKETAEMAMEELTAEVEGWRVIVDSLPKEVFEWMARLQSVVRFTRRNYEGSTGILLGFTLKPVEFTIGLTEVGFDAVSGKRMLETKILVLPYNAIMYHEFIDDRSEYDATAADRELADIEIG